MSPIEAAIESLHAAVVQVPDAPITKRPRHDVASVAKVEAIIQANQSAPLQKPANLVEAAVEATAFYSEDRPAESGLVRSRLAKHHGIKPELATPILKDASDQGLLVLTAGKVALTDEGRDVAVTRGWLQASPLTAPSEAETMPRIEAVAVEPVAEPPVVPFPLKTAKRARKPQEPAKVVAEVQPAPEVTPGLPTPPEPAQAAPQTFDEVAFLRLQVQTQATAIADLVARVQALEARPSQPVSNKSTGRLLMRAEAKPKVGEDNRVEVGSLPIGSWVTFADGNIGIVRSPSTPRWGYMLAIVNGESKKRDLAATAKVTLAVRPSDAVVVLLPPRVQSIAL